MQHTEHTIAAALGLKPLDEFALAAYRSMVSEESVRMRSARDALSDVRYGKRTGKTTRVICQALALLANGAAVRIECGLAHRTHMVVVMVLSHADRLQIAATRAGSSNMINPAVPSTSYTTALQDD